MCATRVYGVGFRVYGIGFCLSASWVAKTLQGDPTTHPRQTQEGGTGDFSWGPARAFNTCVFDHPAYLIAFQNCALLKLNNY